MTKVINAIFEDGVIKPLEKVDIKEHEKIRIIITNEVETAPQNECSLTGIIDIAQDCPDTDLSVHHDKYLYGEVLD